jgi:hypothetical protein
VAEKQLDMLKCEPKMHLMSGRNFGVLTPVINCKSGRRWENSHGINGHVGHVHSSSCKEG